MTDGTLRAGKACLAALEETAERRTLAAAGGASRFRAACFVVAMLLVLGRALPVLSNVPGRDQGTYLTIGRSLLQGRVLYRDLWENKPPGIFYIYGLIGKAFGTRMWCVAAADLALLLVVSWCIFHFAERYLGPAGAAVAVIVHGVWHVEAGYIFTAQPEFFQLPLIFGAYFLVAGASLREQSRLRARHLAAGMLLGTAFWLKYNAVVFLPWLLVPYLDGRALNDRPSRLALTVGLRDLFEQGAWIILGFGSVVLGVIAYFGLEGALPALREVQFQVLPRYAAMAVEARPLPLGQWIAVRSEICLGAATLVATAVALVVARWRRDLARTAPLFTGAAAAYAATAIQMRFHGYYFATCYPFFALIWAYLAVTLWELCRGAAHASACRHWRLGRVLVWLLFASILCWPVLADSGRAQVDYGNLREWRSDPENFYRHHSWIWLEHMDGQLQVIHYLKANAAPADQIFLWGGHTLICYLAERPCVTRFVSNLGLMSLWAPQAWRDEAARQLRVQQPSWIVVARADALPSITFLTLSSDRYLANRYPDLATLVREEYTPVADFSTFVVYRHNR